MTAIRATSEPIVARSEGGEVHLSPDDGLTWIIFRTENAWAAWLEMLDRLQVSYDLDNWRSPIGADR